MRVAHLFPQVLADLRPGRVGSDREVGSGHPVDEVTLEDGCVLGDDRAPLLRRQLFRVGERREDGFDRSVYMRLD